MLTEVRAFKRSTMKQERKKRAEGTLEGEIIDSIPRRSTDIER